jgi:glycosyltransferase involved in cell wall biosynthesis
MRVLHVTHQYKPAIGGSERFITDVSEELVRRGHEVDVVTTRARDYRTWASVLPASERLDGVHVRRFRALQRRKYLWRAMDFGYIGYRRARRRAYEPFILAGSGPVSPGLALWTLLHARRYDVVHIQTLPYAHVVYAGAAARARGVPVVITPHLHVDQPEVFDVGSFHRALRRADMVVADTGREAEFLVGLGVTSQRVREVGVGLKLDEYPTLDRDAIRDRLGIPRDAFVMLFLGRKVAYKGLTSVIRAHERLCGAHPDLWLISAGPAGDTPAGTHDATPGRLPRWIDFDTVTDAHKLDLLNACDLLALPSTAEAFGIVFLEAWAVGKPVIGARAGATPWLVTDGHDGLLVDPGDVDHLTGTIQRLLTDRALGPWLGANGRRKLVERYSLDRIAARFEDIYGAVARPRRVVAQPARVTS